MHIALHCKTELKAFCTIASNLVDGDDNSAQIDDFVSKHLSLMRFVESANSVFQIAICGQLLTALGLFVVISFQVRFGIDFCAAFVLLAIAVQLFFFCFLSECIYDTVR